MTHDAVNHPKHYTSHPSGIECITITRHMGFNLGNAVKYVWRADLKADAIEDLRKAAWYINDEIERRERARGQSPIERAIEQRLAGEEPLTPEEAAFLAELKDAPPGKCVDVPPGLSRAQIEKALAACRAWMFASRKPEL